MFFSFYFQSLELFKEKMCVLVKTMVNLKRIDEEIHLKFCSLSLQRFEFQVSPSPLPVLANPESVAAQHNNLFQTPGVYAVPAFGLKKNLLQMSGMETVD